MINLAIAVSARWVPKMLSDEHKRQTVEISQILLHRCQQEGDETVDVGPGGDHRARNKLLGHLITGDETWLHLSTPETKRDSVTWKHPSSPVTKKFKVQQSAIKVMATVFRDSRGMILLDTLPKGESVNADRYCETLERRPTLEAAVHVSNNTCFSNTLFFWCERTPSRQLVGASELSFVFYSLVLRQWLCRIRERGLPLRTHS
ncbi:histone-lysine N-methyltransferase SETMAR [Plakobranchus ocellatus]|uniref:Histone-lysine N-methyltransferase SETMAR n=1 Tax=Plakobranchus ocellatus TaxID=259542 RepID=A0AAV3XUD6_9GAST|nr:histone-lysine N-methyltransferase SETMAR [Plakobranchus ocellatus]